MHFFRHLVLYIAITAVIFLVVGLIRPWMMLWWEDVQNRRKVIRVYGMTAAIFYGLYWILYFVN